MNKLFKFSLAIAAVVSIASCSKNNLVVDRTDFQTPAYAEFLIPAVKIAISATDTVGELVQFGTTNVATVDRTINLTYSSPTGAILGTDYFAPTTAVVKAGKALDAFIVKGNYAKYATGVRDSVKVKITGGSLAPFKTKDSCWIVLQQYCPVVLTDLEGDYTNTNEFGTTPYGPYITTISNLVSVPGSTTMATGEIANIYDNGWTNITFTIDWTKKSNLKFNIPPQSTGSTDGNVRSSSSRASSFSSCDQEFTFFVDIYNPTTGAVTTANYPIVMKR